MTEDNSTKIEVGEAEYNFDGVCENGDNMWFSLLLTDFHPEVRGDIARAFTEWGVETNVLCETKGFLAITTETINVNYNAAEEILNACLPDYDPRYQIVVNESDYGAHVALVTVE